MRRGGSEVSCLAAMADAAAVAAEAKGAAAAAAETAAARQPGAPADFFWLRLTFHSSQPAIHPVGSQMLRLPGEPGGQCEAEQGERLDWAECGGQRVEQLGACA